MEGFVNFGQTLGIGVAGRENDRDGKTRDVNLSDGRTVRVESRDPYGFWYVNWGRGQLPDELKGTYTNAEYALRAVQAYLGNNKYDTKIVEEKVEIPVLKYKKEKSAA